MDKIFNNLLSLGLDSGIVQTVLGSITRILVGLAIWIIGFWLIKKFQQLLEWRMKEQNFDPTLQGFLSSLLNFGMKGFIAMASISTMGLELTSLLAVLGGAAIGVGMALQGSLSNFAGGLLILLFKPFKVGDLIESEGHMGFVKAIDLLNSTILTPGNKEIFIPNANVFSSSITNLSSAKYIRVRTRVGVSYDANIDFVREKLLEAIKSDGSFINKDSSVDIEEFGDSSINLVIASFVKPINYWPALYRLNGIIKTTFDTHNIEIPFPQRVIHTKIN